MSNHCNVNESNTNEDSILGATRAATPKKGMVMPFTPLAMSFDNVNYFVEMPLV